MTYVVEWGGGIEHPVSLTLGPLGDTVRSCEGRTRGSSSINKDDEVRNCRGLAQGHGNKQQAEALGTHAVVAIEGVRTREWPSPI